MTQGYGSDVWRAQRASRNMVRNREAYHIMAIIVVFNHVSGDLFIIQSYIFIISTL